MRILRSATSGAAGLAAAVVVVVPLVQPGGPLGPDLALAAGAVSVTGSVSELRAGVPARLVLTVENDDSRAVVVRRLTAQVVSGGVPGCPADALRISPWSGRLPVPGGGSAQPSLEVVLDADAHCDAVRWQLRYTAEGE